VVEADFVLALNAARYLEEGRDQVVSKLLNDIPERVRGLSDLEFEIAQAVRSSLPISESHEPQLRMLMKGDDIIGGAAISRLVELKGATIKDELLLLLLEAREDFNHCPRIGEALKLYATNDDIRKIAVWADSLQDKMVPDFDRDKVAGFIRGAARFLDGLDLTEVSQELFSKAGSWKVPNLRIEILRDVLDKHHSTASLDLAAELLLKGVDNIAATIHSITNSDEPDCNLSWSSFNTDHVDRLEFLILGPHESFGGYVLKDLCAARSDLADWVKHRASKKSGLAKAFLLYFASAINMPAVFDAIGKLTAMNEEERRQEPTHLLNLIDIYWAGKEDLFVQLLRLRDTQLVLSLLGYVIPYWNPSLGSLEIGPIEWWLEWMMEQGDLSGSWFCEHLGGLFADHLKDEARDAFVTEFNKSGSKFRRLLLDFILPFRRDLTTDAFSEDTISFLLADLGQDRGRPTSFLGHLLGVTATEQFVTERLLPLLPDAKSPFLESLQNALRQAGSRHGRRYVSG
jgi:hypothetical protein